MTNPTLERAARALSDHFGCEWDTMRDADREMIRGYCRAVLIAVRSEVVAELGEECETDRVLSAILADGGE